MIFATNWKAQAAHGGFYQARADGTYRKYGLEVTIQPGGPQVNNRPLLPAGRIDFLMTGNLLHNFDNVKNGVPTGRGGGDVPEGSAGADRPPARATRRSRPRRTRRGADRQGRAVLLVAVAEGDARLPRRGAQALQLQPRPLPRQPQAIQQGYSVAEPIYVENQGRFKPVVHLLADHGFSTYSTVIEARIDTVKNKPDLVQRFVDASILGWVNYLYGQRAAANALMIRTTPDDRGRARSLGGADEAAGHRRLGQALANASAR